MPKPNEPALEATIRAAFPQVPPSRDIEAELRAYNSYPDTEEVNARFAGKNWWDIPDAVLIDHVDPPTLLAGVNAFQYYLPAMLLAAIRYPDSCLVGSLILSFQAPKKPENLVVFRRRFSPF